MIQGSTAAAPWTDRAGTATSNRCPDSVNVWCTGVAPAPSPVVAPPTVSCSAAVSVAAARSQRSGTNTTTNPGRTTPRMRRGASRTRKSPLVPSRSVSRGVARVPERVLARASAAGTPVTPPRSIPGTVIAGMPETRVAGR